NLWDAVGWKTTRIAHLIPEHGRELLPNDSYILELGFERLNGVDFKKGCYVGQEVTARMKHKTELRKGLARVMVSGAAEEGDLITANGREVGRLHSISGDQALAYLRFDRAEPSMQAGAAKVHFVE
ncbi:MAG: folate-binding protein, partial [Paracoccaceae bacterium]